MQVRDLHGCCGKVPAAASCRCFAHTYRLPLAISTHLPSHMCECLVLLPPVVRFTAWQGLSQEARRMQLLACRAQLQATKHSFMLLSRAFTSWQQLVALRRRLEAVTDTLQARP